MGFSSGLVYVTPTADQERFYGIPIREGKSGEGIESIVPQICPRRPLFLPHLARLAEGFDLQSRMRNPHLHCLLPGGALQIPDLVVGAVPTHHQVRGQDVVLAVQGPEVGVMDTLDAGEPEEGILNPLDGDGGGDALQEDDQGPPEIPHDVVEDEDRDDQGEEGVQDGQVPDPEDDAHHEYSDPAQHVLHQVPGDHGLVHRLSPVDAVRSGTVGENAQDGEEDHPLRVHGLWREDSGDGQGQDQHGPDDEHDGIHDGRDQGEPPVPVGENGRLPPCSNPLEEPGQPQGEGVPQVVEGVRRNGQAVGQDAARELDEGEEEVYDKGGPDVLLAAVHGAVP